MQTKNTSAADQIIAILGKDAVRADAAQRAAEALLARGMLSWLAEQPESTREEIFVAVEAPLSQSERRKIAVHALRPNIDPARIEVAREKIAAAQIAAREEKKKAAEEAKRQREAAAEERRKARAAKELEQFRALQAKFESASLIAAMPLENEFGDDMGEQFDT